MSRRDEFVPSAYQAAVYTWVASGEGHGLVEAVAGSGKTTTIINALMIIPPTMRIVLFAFNKAIAAELADKVPAHCTARTFHSAGMAAWRSAVGKVRVDTDKCRKILRSMIMKTRPDLYRKYAALVLKLVDLAKGAGAGRAEWGCTHHLVELDDDLFADLMAHHGIDLAEDQIAHEAFWLATKVIAYSYSQRNVIDFNDMLLFPVVYGAAFPKHDWVLGDEAQDLNGIQRAVVFRSLKPDGRMLAVGDPCQAIYGFRGASSDSMDQIRAAFGCTVLPLSITYRCSSAIVKAAQAFVPHIEARDGVAPGEVADVQSYTVDSFRPTDGIVCRNTAPLVGMAYGFIQRGRGVKLMGRSIGKGLSALVEKLNAQGVDRLIEKLDAWLERETLKAEAAGKESTIEGMEDKHGCIMQIIDNLPETGRTVPAVLRAIERLFTDNAGSGILTLCTIHRSKGLEWDRVWILDAWRMPSKFATLAWQQQQEANLHYVAITRAKHAVYYIDADRWKRA